MMAELRTAPCFSQATQLIPSPPSPLPTREGTTSSQSLRVSERDSFSPASPPELIDQNKSSEIPDSDEMQSDVESYDRNNTRCSDTLIKESPSNSKSNYTLSQSPNLKSFSSCKQENCLQMFTSRHKYDVESYRSCETYPTKDANSYSSRSSSVHNSITFSGAPSSFNSDESHHKSYESSRNNEDSRDDRLNHHPVSNSSESDNHHNTRLPVQCGSEIETSANDADIGPEECQDFNGEIIYSPDGSAYIVDEPQVLDDSSFFSDLKKQNGSISESRNFKSSSNCYPLISNAVHIKHSDQHDHPVYTSSSSLRSLVCRYEAYEPESSETTNDDTAEISKMRRTLMCFLCKYSFSSAKSFVAHASTEHHIELSEAKRCEILKRNASSIIQFVGSDRTAILVILKLVLTENSDNPTKPKELDYLPEPKRNCSSPSNWNNRDVEFRHSGKSYENEPGATPSEQSDSECLRDRFKSTANSSRFDPLMFANISGLVKTEQLESNNLSFGSWSRPNGSVNIKLEKNNNDISGNESVSSGVNPMAISTIANYRLPGSSKLSSDLQPIRNIVNGYNYLTSSHVSTSLTNGLYHSSADLGLECDEHPTLPSPDCQKCENFLSRSRSPSSQSIAAVSAAAAAAAMHTRNSCKTLKCPKCNWHYKYQETLEIHMKEKHPDGETQCPYCINGQSHPRLARGESYTCGYKPYRCDICNYSTTTKGNLSIHLQSDKHTNNMQELQNSAAGNSGPPVDIKMSMTPPVQHCPSTSNMTGSSPMQISASRKNKQRATWRCDFCSYETNEARNLRIHMTSEKHAHNLLTLQQNVSDMQMNPMGLFPPQDPRASMLSMPALMGLLPPAAFDPAVFGVPPMLPPLPESAMDLTKPSGEGFGKMADVNSSGSSARDRFRDETVGLFQCSICDVFSSDSLEALQQHIQLDRSKYGNTCSEQDAITVLPGGTHLCNLCQYKTGLKANFQLHCKTDKHLQRLQLVNHIQEGTGGNTELLSQKLLSAGASPVQVACTACDYHTNSVYRLQMHSTGSAHDVNARLYRHLTSAESRLRQGERAFGCCLCNFWGRTKQSLIEHAQSVRHIQKEGLLLPQVHERMRDRMESMFVVQPWPPASGDSQNANQDGKNMMTFEEGGSGKSLKQESSMLECITEASNKKVKTGYSVHSTERHGEEGGLERSDLPDSLHQKTLQFSSSGKISCILCAEQIEGKDQLRRHLITTHRVKAETLHGIMLLVDSCPSTASQCNNLDSTACPSKYSGADSSSTEINGRESPSWASAKSASTVLKDDKMPDSSEYKEGHESGITNKLKQDLLEREAIRLAEEAALDSLIITEQDLSSPVVEGAQFRCTSCPSAFPSIGDLCAHQNELGHLGLTQTASGPGYACWRSGCEEQFKTAEAVQQHYRDVHSTGRFRQPTEEDIELFNSRCNQCNLAFKTEQSLKAHSYYHIIRAATNCLVCDRKFESITDLRNHVECEHMRDMSADDVNTYKDNMAAASSLALLGGSDAYMSVDNESEKSKKLESHCDDSDISCDKKSNTGTSSSFHKELFSKLDENFNANLSADADMDSSDMQAAYEEYMRGQPDLHQGYLIQKYKCHRCKVGFPKLGFLSAHNKTLQHRQGSKIGHPLEKYYDPNRPFKCEICLESFTQKNILLVHYNSVSHLHRFKQHQQQLMMQASMSSKSESGSTKNHNSSDNNRRPVTSLGQNDFTMKRENSFPTLSASHDDEPMETSDKQSEHNSQKLTGHNEMDSEFDRHHSPRHMNDLKKLPSESFSSRISSLSDVLFSSHELSGSKRSSETDLEKNYSSGDRDSLEKLYKTMYNKSLASTLFSESKLYNKTLQQNNTSTSDKLSTLHKSEEDIYDKIKRHSDSNNVTGKPESHPNITIPHICQFCDAMFTTAEYLAQHKSNCSKLLNHIRQIPSYSVSCKSNLYMALLENFGFECVMQYNENRQKTKKNEEKSENNTNYTETEAENKLENVKDEGQDEIEDVEENEESNSTDKISEEDLNKSKSEQNGEDSECTEEKSNVVDLPEIQKSECKHCMKQFSSIWVLKAHEEEVHKDVLSFEQVFEFGRHFAKMLNKKQKTTQNCGDSKINSEAQSPSSKSSKKSDMRALNFPASLAENMNYLSAPLPLDLCGSQAAQMLQLPFLMGMNMLPPLLPMMPLGSELFGLPPFPVVDPMLYLSQQKQQLQQQQKLISQQNQSANLVSSSSASNLNSQQKSGRTRINDEQLNILRAHFDINNSPSEEQIFSMSEKTGLLPKVIKHWFRNTLFKERQRSKDSPYNFSIPPSTTLNLEEYEKVNKYNKAEQMSSLSKNDASPESMDSQQINSEMNSRHQDSNSAGTSQSMQTESKSSDDRNQSKLNLPTSAILPPSLTRFPLTNPFFGPGSADLSNAMLSSLMQMAPLYMPPAILPPLPLVRPSSAKLSSMQLPVVNCPSSSGSLSNNANQERRANRTRFTNTQMQVLQEFFEKNAYPKDDELESLSKLLDLSPRVIVVWFQNARQKVRKIYENQTPQVNQPRVSSADENSMGSSSYQCKKCNTNFSQYYEFVKHKRSVCFSDDDIDSAPMSSMSNNMEEVCYYDDDDADSRSYSSNQSTSHDSEAVTLGIDYRCEKCSMTFVSLESWKNHQAVHVSLEESLSSNKAPPTTSTSSGYRESSSSSSYGGGGLDDSLLKHNWSDDGDSKDDQPKDKRMRTTILPEQLDYLYHVYQSDCNPSRKQLDAIATKVGLKKRVVQVWFQNTRARERKGQYRAHQQLIHKRCPFCKALFRAKSALEAHLATKHPDEMAGNDINVDNIPDDISDGSSVPMNHQEPNGHQSASGSSSLFGGLSSPLLPCLPPTPRALGNTDVLQANMQRLYEDSFKKYIDELSHVSHQFKFDLPNIRTPEATSTPIKNFKQEEAPLDLRMPLSAVSSHSSSSMSYRLDCDDFLPRRHSIADDSRSEDCRSDNNDDMSLAGGAAGSNDSPDSPNSSHYKHQSWQTGKRYRTQMSSIQIKVMKGIFIDYKTPTMSECEVLGREIGLPKRVVQVWFQNARAKEKKNILICGDSSNPAAIQANLINPQPEKCGLCGVQYSLQYTVQDHLFTKTHIDRVKAAVRGQREVSSSSQECQMYDRLSRDKVSDYKHRSYSSGSAHQKSAPAISSEFTGNSVSNELTANSRSKMQSVGPSTPSLNTSAASLLPPFSGYPIPPPCDVMSMMPYLYPGAGLPFLSPSLFPGTSADMLMYDPTNFGTPLSLLHIPPQAIQTIQEKAADKDCVLTFYSQDCHSFSDLENCVGFEDWKVSRKTSIDVGYICKKCHIVYPGKPACVNHQLTKCFKGSDAADLKLTILKLEQMQYECTACKVRFSTIDEYKKHCEQDQHRQSVHSSSQSVTQDQHRSSSSAASSASETNAAGSE